MTLELDLHGLTSEEAIYAIQRTIVNNPLCDYIEVIHGFNNGSVLKDLLSNKSNIHNRRVLATYPKPYNKGRTVIALKKIKH